MSPRDTDQLLESALSAWRPRSPDGVILPHPAWADLDAASRVRLFEMTVQARSMEQALDPAGLSTTAYAVLSRIRAARDW